MYLHSSAKTTTSLSFPLPHMKFAHQFFRNASSLPHSPSLLSNSSLPRRTRCPCMDSHTLISSSAAVNRQKEKLIVIIGATGSGKSRLSLDLATRHFPRSEIINSDKMQVYRGLDITTNKMPFHERLGVPHHFLGEIEEIDSDFAPSEFRDLAGLTIGNIVSGGNLPLLVGGPNSFIYAMLAKKFDPKSAKKFLQLSISQWLYGMRKAINAKRGRAEMGGTWAVVEWGLPDWCDF